MEKMDAPWLNKDNLEKWLKTRVLELVMKDPELKGDNYMSDMYRLQVKTEESDMALIVKCRLKDETDESLSDTLIFKKEQEIYENTVPRMNKLLRQANLDNFKPIAPRCVYSCEDFLVMQDLSAEGYKMLDRCKGLDLEQCLTVMRTIARFHAASVVLLEQDPQSMKVFDTSTFSEPSSVKSMGIYFETMVNMLIEELETWPAAQWGPYIGKLRNIKDDILERFLKVCERNDSEYNALIHGDLWTNNILFRGDVAKLIDFQIAHYTSPGIDLVLFLTTSPNMEVRMNHTDRLIEEYHANLCSTLTALGSKKLLTLEEVYQIYRRKAFYGIFGVVTEAAVMTADPNSGFSLDEAMKGRTPGRQMYSEFFKDIVKWNFPLMDRLGVFDVK